MSTNNRNRRLRITVEKMDSSGKLSKSCKFNLNTSLSNFELKEILTEDGYQSRVNEASAKMVDKIIKQADEFNKGGYRVDDFMQMIKDYSELQKNYEDLQNNFVELKNEFIEFQKRTKERVQALINEDENKKE